MAWKVSGDLFVRELKNNFISHFMYIWFECWIVWTKRRFLARFPQMKRKTIAFHNKVYWNSFTQHTHSFPFTNFLLSVRNHERSCIFERNILYCAIRIERNAFNVLGVNVLLSFLVFVSYPICIFGLPFMQSSWEFC